MGFLLPVRKTNKPATNCNFDTNMKAENSITQFYWELSKKSTLFHSAIMIITDIEVD